MDTQNSQTENVATRPAPVTCRRYVKQEKATFFANLKDHFTDFVNSPYAEHKACIQETMNKMFGGLSKKVEVKEVESPAAPLQAAVKTQAA